MKYSMAITLPVNPPSVSVTLTKEQCWSALVSKARDPQPFLPIALDDCTITEDRGEDGLTRRVKVLNGWGLVKGEYDEVIVYHRPARMEFQIPDQKLNVINLISSSPGANADIYLTIAYVVDWPGVEEGSPEATHKIENIHTVGRRALEMTLLASRRLALEGKL